VFRYNGGNMSILFNSIIFWGLTIFGFVAGLLLSRKKLKLPLLTSIIISILSLLFFAWLGLFILGSLGSL